MVRLTSKLTCWPSHLRGAETKLGAPFRCSARFGGPSVDWRQEFVYILRVVVCAFLLPLLIVGLQSAPREIDLFALTVHEIEVTTTLAHVCDVDLPESLQIISGSDLASIVLDRVIPLDALVDEGIRPLAEGTARGKIVINPIAA